jgi:hypothetical protein
MTVFPRGFLNRSMRVKCEIISHQEMRCAGEKGNFFIPLVSILETISIAPGC